MSNIKMDAYAVVVGLEYYDTPDFYLKAHDFVSISDTGIVRLENSQVGSIAKQEKYYDEAENILDTLLEYNTYNLVGEDYCFFEREDINEFFSDESGFSIAQVVYADKKKAIVYLGTGMSNDFFPEDEESYELTDLGREILSILEDCPGAQCSIEYEEEIQETTCDFSEMVSVERKEENIMDNVFGKFGFGKCQDSRFSLSINGIAVRQASTGKFVVYNKDNNEFVDTTDMLINIKDALFLLPAVEVNVGDTIIHEGKPYYIIDTRNEIKAVSYDECTQTVLIPKSTMFGLKYFTKVFSMFGDNFAASGELFSNPMMLMALMGEDNDTDFGKFLLMSSMSKGDLASNPMLMTFLMKDGKSDLSTLAMMSMLSNGNNPFATTTVATKKKPADKE